MATKKKELVSPPTKRELADAARELRKGHPAGSKVLLDQKAAIAQKVVKKKRGGV